MLYNKLSIIALAPLALAATTTTDDSYGLGAQISAAMAEYSAVPGVSEMMSVYEKYATVSGFDNFNSALAEKIASYALTQTVMTAVPTATDPAALVSDPAVVSMVSELDTEILDFASTQTYLPSGAKTSLVSDFSKALAAAQETGTKASKTATAGASATASGVETQASNAAGVMKAGMMGVAAAAGAAAAALL